MPKLNEEKILDAISQQPIDDQISFYEKLKATITANIMAHQEMLSNDAYKYQNIKDRINGN